MNNIITPDEAQSLGRPLGKIDNKKLQAFIQEAEDFIVKPYISDALYVELTKNEVEEKYSVFLSGGAYTTKSGEVRSFQGLKVAVSYLVYAKVAMSGDVESTRYGMVMKNGQFSNHLDDKNRSTTYNDAFEVAYAYMRQCVDYAKDQGFISQGYRPKKTISAGGVTIRKIG